MTKQLSLVPTASWRFDAQTRQIGLQGVAAAREALAEARRNLAAQHDYDEVVVGEAA